MKHLHRAFLLLSCIFVLSCAHTEFEASRTIISGPSAERIAQDNEIYRPYSERNNLEGYREFIAKYPDNINIGRAWAAIQDIELTNCYDAECLKEFIAAYPSSLLIGDAKERLKAFTDKDFNKEMAADYGFDLPLYRLNLKRLRKELIDMGQAKLTHFSETFSIKKHEGKNYFCTRLDYPNNPALSGTAPQSVENLFNFMIAPQLDYLMVKFKKKQKIDGFSFEIIGLNSAASSSQLYFLIDQIDRYLDGSLTEKDLLKAALLNPLQTVSTAPAPASAQKKEASEENTIDKKIPAAMVLPWTSEPDGVAKNGKFMRTSIPAFSLDYPQEWRTAEPAENCIFNTYPQRMPSVQIAVLHMGNGGDTEANRLAWGEIAVKGYQQYLIKKQLTKTVHLEFSKLERDQKDDTFYEFLMTWKLLVGPGSSFNDPIKEMLASRLPRIATYGRVVFTKDHVIVLTGSVLELDQQEQFDQLKKIFGTLKLAQEKEPSVARSVSVPVSMQSTVKKENALPPNRDMKIDLQLIAPVSTDYNLSERGRLVRTTPPLFALSYPQEWSVQQRSESLLFSAKAGGSLQVMISKITGDESLYLESFANNYMLWLKQGGYHTDLIYNVHTDVYGRHQAFEFEMRFRLQSEKSVPPRTLYGNVIAKDGYAIILMAETDGDMDTFKSLFETIDLKRRSQVTGNR